MIWLHENKTTEQIETISSNNNCNRSIEMGFRLYEKCWWLFFIASSCSHSHNFCSFDLLANWKQCFWAVFTNSCAIYYGDCISTFFFFPHLFSHVTQYMCICWFFDCFYFLIGWIKLISMFLFFYIFFFCLLFSFSSISFIAVTRYHWITWT